MLKHATNHTNQRFRQAKKTTTKLNMKKILTTVLLILCTFQLTAQKINIYSKLSGIELIQIEGESAINYDLIKETDGKIVIIEFWETWCAPCIEGMHHLKALKNKFSEKLKIICVSSDNFARTTKFIDNNSFPFDFIYDKEKKLSERFPHTGIPHSVFIDNKGNIESETFPGLLTEAIIKKIIDGDSVKVPEKKNFTAKSLEKSFSENSIKNALISFELLPHQLGDRNYTESSKRPNKRTIISGYSGNVSKDTIEIIESYKSAGNNILQLYMRAYDEFTENRFIFDEDLNYIKSQTPNNRFRVKFEASNMLGDYNTLFLRQLNSAFGFKSYIIEKEVDYYELVNIKLKKGSIMSSKSPGINTKGTTNTSFKQFNISQILSSKKIANLIENQIVYLQSNKYYDLEEKRIYYPVVTELTAEYALNILIEDESSSLEKWITLLEQNGMTLRKKKGKVQYVKIEEL